MSLTALVSRSCQPVVRVVAALTVGMSLCLPALSAAAAAGDAKGYPNDRPIRFIVPYAPGGLPDTVARITSQRLSERLGSSVVVENRPGANGVIAAQALMSQPADGLTFLVTDGSMMSINPYLYPNLAYDYQRDFEPVSLVATSPLFLAAHASFPANTLDEFVALVKKQPGKFTYGSSGIGSSHHLSMEAMKTALGLQLDHVPFRGSGQSVPALVGNQVPMVFSALPSLSGFVSRGEVKLLAVNSAKRSDLAPNVPAVAELIPDYDFAPTVGILARKGTPPAVVDLVSRHVAEIAHMDTVVTTMRGLGIEPVGGDPETYRKAIAAEAERYGAAIQAAGVKGE
ncbi:Bug family tripartite tricarboxylate transporter substrate binding protein [Verticiella alkaliphila]|uniref:Bug family tripartite tricarboxylate transporter substrate binding protein n=1 Tax=Verticiella alkaliphila TaxID=2779529 RepID=UPI00209A6749|nr:tripartite tricarboxylate transporter substrate binding protein [Verticiella sp. GG226]